MKEISLVKKVLYLPLFVVYQPLDDPSSLEWSPNTRSGKSFFIQYFILILYFQLLLFSFNSLFRIYQYYDNQHSLTMFYCFDKSISILAMHFLLILMEEVVLLFCIL